MRHFQRQPLAISESCETDCGLCATLGCLRPSTLGGVSFSRELDMLEWAAPREIVLPPNAIDHPEADSFVREIRGRGIEAIVRIRPSRLLQNREIVSALEYRGARFELVIDRPVTDEQFDAITDFESHVSSVLVVLNRSIDAEAVVEALPPSLTNAISLLAPLETSGRFFGPDEIFRLMTSSRSLRGIPSAGDLQTRSRFLETGVRAEVRMTSSNRPTDFLHVSIVIPFKTGFANLERVLGALASQDHDPSTFEILVVCDRSSEDDIAAIENWARTNPDVTTSVLTLDETGARAADFRAGLARNAGAFRARGGLLVFLDSDALVPADFVSDVSIAHETADVIQYRRIDEANEQESYWESFYRHGDWMSLEDRWKYVTSFALSIKLADFLLVGGFSPAFDRYGCEDTHLGWALDRLGRRFTLRPLDVTHVGGRVRLRRESSRAKMKRITASARAFYLATLDEAVYRTFFAALGPSLGLRWLARSLVGVRP